VVDVAVPDSSPVGLPIHAEVTIHNLAALAQDFTCYVLVRVIAQNGSEIGVVTGPRTDPVTITPNGTATIPSDVPWAAIQPWISSTDFVQFDVVVTRVSDQRVWIKDRIVRIRGLPVGISINPAARITLPGAGLVSVTYSNPLDTPLTNAVLTISGDAGLLIGGTAASEVVALGTIPPNGSATIQRTVNAAIEGQRGMNAHFAADGAVPGDAFITILVFRCPADFDDGSGTGTRDGGVTLDDLLYYLALYAGGDIRADLDDGTGTGARDRGVTLDDLLYFLDHFNAGC
jgi:hypothetical protein